MRLFTKVFIHVFIGMAIGGLTGIERVLAEDADHLILSEVVVKSRAPFSYFGSPYILVVNPTDTDWDMSQVYLTDGTTSPTAFYYFLTLSDPQTNNPGGGNGGDFHARFPDGYVLAAGDSLSVSMAGSDQFQEAYGRLPDFELFEDGVSVDAVPEMVEVFPGSISAGLAGGSNIPVFSDIAESIVMYTWDGSSDLVQDMDYLLWGTNEGVRIDKTDVTIGSGTYAPDTPLANQEAVASAGANFAHSFRRVSADEGSEVLTGGNGLTGHDETSENLANTWQEVNVASAGLIVPTAPDTWHPAAPMILEASINPHLPYEGLDVNLQISLISFSDINSVIFYYNVDGGSFQDLQGTLILEGDYYATVPPQDEGAVITWYCTAENENGGVAVHPVEAPLYLLDWTVREAPDPSLFPTKLLITEVCPLGTSEEFIEIWNPSDHDVDMGNYYIGDAVYYTQGYWNIGAGASPATVGGGIYADFQARFPDGYVLAAGDTTVISLAGSMNFMASYGFLPHLELYEDDYLADDIPDMRPVFETADGNSIITTVGSNPSFPTLANSGESVALYHWIEGEDLVTDIDIFIWGAGGSYSIDKTGITVGESTYMPDNPLETFTTPVDFGFSFTRVDGLEGVQIPTGSNGVMGRDETSENWTQTFQILPRNPAQGDPLYPVEGQWQNIWPYAGQQGVPASHAWGDVSGNGRDDLYLVNSQAGFANQLFGSEGNGQFFEVPWFDIGSNESDQAAAWADMHNDDDLDLLVIRSSGQNICYMQLFHEYVGYYFMGFSDGGMQQDNQSVAAAWVDHNHDGQLEVYVANMTSASQLLFSQYGFFDFTPEALLFSGGCSNFAWCDFDMDFDEDLCVLAADGQVHILTNVGEGVFIRETQDIGPGSSHCSWADFDNDGDFDLLVTMIDQPNLLLQNQGDAGFQATPLPEAAGSLSSRQAVWGDFDNDGFQDIYVVNFGSSNLLLHNEAGTGNFTVVNDEDISLHGENVAASWNDVDADGDLDLFVNSLSGNQLMRNNRNNGDHYLSVRLSGNSTGQQANMSAIGALIKVTVGGETQWRYVAGDGATKVQHFGLGAATMVDELVVYWPYKLNNGQHHTTRWSNIEGNRRVDIQEPMLGLSAASESTLPSSFALLPCHPNPFNPTTSISFDVPQGGDVDLEIFDLAGRRIRTLHLGETFEAGRHTAIWNGTDDQGRSLASGVYQIRLKAQGFKGVQRATLIK